ncbi:MAG: hypothetical protein A2534_01275 [Candidatus Magasanikbacteria bacterium RIFOXYD2_FULL_39_9]|uniref:Uncharacterized protein n=1 Tax=Candidatus Magasanikbacteria bacterium RIFOXYD1_FULL_40_23 TaxID=1798705 RepID=A0A1F6P9E9_9BACT|nr:MAG: hypothetical protein A2534_01275 [Candidatus Magasanikbacteria bacterium RIFOXYD2_FULL_39_9]OGH92660.1 MAG: hypothetical protein A2563_03225 [Candidatus Magasanikbacteria bacterium RIFOXYD1_FULL_40_23]
MNRIVSEKESAVSGCLHNFIEASIQRGDCSVQYVICSRCGRCKLWICNGHKKWPEVGVKTLDQARDALISAGQILDISAGVILDLDARMVELFPAHVSSLA